MPASLDANVSARARPSCPYPSLARRSKKNRLPCLPRNTHNRGRSRARLSDAVRRALGLDCFVCARIQPLSVCLYWNNPFFYGGGREPSTWSENAMARRGDSCQREYRFRWNETLLSEVQMARHCATFQISLGQHAAYSRVVQRLNARDHLTVLALGGSAIYGADCHDRRVAPQECSFPGRFVRALRLSYCMDEGYLKFVNHASGGQGRS